MNRLLAIVGSFAFVLSLLTTHLPLTTAQEPKKDDKKDDKKDEKKDEPAAKEVKLRWYGQSFFQLVTARNIRIVFDPHAIPQFGRELVRADFVLISHPHNDHDQVAALADPKPKESEIYRGVV